MLFTALNVVLDGPGRKLGDLGDVGDLRELSPSFSSPGFRLGPTCKSRKLGDEKLRDIGFR